MAIVLPEVAGGRIVGIACRALLRNGPEGSTLYKCQCPRCTARMLSGCQGSFNYIEALAEHWEIGRLKAICSVNAITQSIRNFCPESMHICAHVPHRICDQDQTQYRFQTI